MGKTFKTKPIKEEGKTPNWYLKAIQAIKKLRHVLLAYNWTHFPQPLHHLHYQQYGSYYNFKQRKEELNKEILQDNLRIGNNGQHPIVSSKYSQVVWCCKQSIIQHWNYSTAKKRNS